MKSAINDALNQPLEGVDLSDFGQTHVGKVRDMCVMDDQRVLVTTDRVSAFDRVLGTIPYKGQVLNQLSGWWFEKLQDVVSNHMISMPDPNVMVTHEAKPLPVEVIVRGYIPVQPRHLFGLCMSRALRSHTDLIYLRGWSRTRSCQLP